ncbi:hypothetical protein RchiOBHm_Chr3g0493811 [Rosa chinensis]|uniref:Uncharacterized protein n=1 Tax=Rosa chinensis TaxID=74649 RepID=A0A2P6RGT7_ROSCH|nr:hypothetical protein RchiOBHm_Chr3g0493811 [Rosa chinensis]
MNNVGMLKKVSFYFFYSLSALKGSSLSLSSSPPQRYKPPEAVPYRRTSPASELTTISSFSSLPEKQISASTVAPLICYP